MKSRNVVIDKHTFDFASHKRDALSKARLDINRTFESIGAYVLTIKVKVGRNRLIGIIDNIWQYIKCMYYIPYKSNVYIQYPALSSRPSYYNVLLKYAKARMCKIIYIIHDIEALRFSLNSEKRESRILNQADILIVHTNAMRDKLKELGVYKPMVVLQLFDYYCVTGEVPNGAQLNYVAFAGNLSKYKSKFIEKLIARENKYVKYRFYGIPNEQDFNKSVNSEYCGSFVPEKVYELHASWGLVWDGDDLDNCSGVGEYLKYNSSHKLSLYIAAGLPLIVWNESAVAEYIKEEQIGVCIDSLLSLDDILSKISQDEYCQMKVRVQNLSQRLKNGQMLKTAIKECDKIVWPE